jgi:hypothetical protein
MLESLFNKQKNLHVIGLATAHTYSKIESILSRSLAIIVYTDTW